MSKLEIIITEQAQADINGIIAYIELDNKKASYEFAKTLKKLFIHLSDFPQMGKKRPEYTNENVLFFTIKWGYSIVYFVEGNNIYILRVLSEYQDYSLLL